MINITGGTVNAVTCGKESRPAIGTVYGNLDLTINSSTGKTTVNAYTTSSDSLPLIGTADHYDSSTHKYDSISPSEGAEYNEDGSFQSAKTTLPSSIPIATLLWALPLLMRPKHLMIIHFMPLMKLMALSTMRSTLSLTKTKVTSPRSSTTASTWKRTPTLTSPNWKAKDLARLEAGEEGRVHAGCRRLCRLHLQH